MSSSESKESIEPPPGRRYAPFPLRARKKSAGDSLKPAQPSIPLIVEDHSNANSTTLIVPTTSSSPPLGSSLDVSRAQDIVGSPSVREDPGGVRSFDLRGRKVPQESFLTSLTPSSDPGFSSYTSRERSVSDVSGVSEDDDRTGVYNVHDEEAPPEPFFTPRFQAALQNGLNVSKRAAGAIQRLTETSSPNTNIERLLEDALSLSVFESCDTRTIAVLGNSGEGKSSLINALLHTPEIAKTGDIGSACTSIVTEYRHSGRTHTAPITIEVEYLSRLEIEDMIKELPWNYRQLFLPGIESDEVDSKEYARVQRESEQAFSALEAAFKHHRSFSRDLLSRDMSEAGLATVTGQMIRWAHELEWPVSSDDNGTTTWKSTAETAEECYESTKIFMQDKFWPFTKIVRVYLRAHVLKAGLVLADLPGLQDTNLARVRATQDYLLKCDNILIVTNIARAITDQSLKSSLYTVLSQHVSVEWEETGGKSLNLAIVCTKSETINETTARREFCGHNKKIPAHVMEQLDRDIDSAKRNGNKELKKALKRKRTFLLVDARNCHIRQGLQDSYSSSVPGGTLEVFCVSNTTYEKFSRKGNKEMVNASGIPELRRFCDTITANSQLHEAMHFIRSSQSSLLNSVGMSLSIKSPIEGHIPNESKIKTVLEEAKQEISKAINKSKTGFKKTFEEVFSEYLEKRNKFWEDAAESKGSEWFGWHHNDELLQSIDEAIDLRVQDIEYKFGLKHQKLLREVKAIRRYASEPNQTSYIVSEMIPAYRSAASQSGTGRQGRQHSIVQGRITDGTLIPQISARIEDSVSKLIQDTFKDVQGLVDSVLELIERDIDMGLAPMRSDTASAQESVAERQRVEEFTADINELREMHAGVLASIADF